MAHDANLVVMGSTRSSLKQITNHTGLMEAGLAVRLSSANALSVTSSDGALLGVSVGKDLSDTTKTSICRRGVQVPLLLTAAYEPVIGAAVTISNSTGMGASSGTAINAVYVTSNISGIGEDGLTKYIALIDFPGGL